jgi:hypothetical protein
MLNDCFNLKNNLFYQTEVYLLSKYCVNHIPIAKLKSENSYD